MEEAKILNAEFRNALYKTLIEAGYDKSEAKKIVGVKLFDALKASVIGNLNALAKDIESDNFLKIDVEPFNESVNELNRLKELLGK